MSRILSWLPATRDLARLLFSKESIQVTEKVCCCLFCNSFTAGRRRTQSILVYSHGCSGQTSLHTMLPTHEELHQRLKVLKSHFTGVREAWHLSQVFPAHRRPQRNSSFPIPYLSQTTLTHWPIPRNALAQGPNLLFKFPAPKFKIRKEEQSVLNPHLPQNPSSHFSQNHRILSLWSFPQNL